MKLQAKTKEQMERVEELLGNTSIHVDKDSRTGLYIDDWVTFDEMAAVVDYLRQPSDKRTDLFELCWVEYNRKGSKKKSLEQWNKLKDTEKDLVLPHIKAYVSSRERQYQKDFERYLKDRTFNDVVLKGNVVYYDPSVSSSNEYHPQESFDLHYNDYYKCYMFTGMLFDYLADGYTDDNRPDGATIKLNNARGTMVWSSNDKKWNKEG